MEAKPISSQAVLKDRDIKFVTYKWIGVHGGYLGDFSYRTHAEFYHDYCDLEGINPYEYEGTTRERFETILTEAEPYIKARILHGVLEKYPVGSAEHRIESLHKKLLELIERCEKARVVRLDEPTTMSEVVKMALADTNTLIANGKPVSAVDRTHTAFHGFLRAICKKRNFQYGKDFPITKLFKIIRQNSPEFQPKGILSNEIERILNSMSSIIDAVNTLRNRGSVAHPNERLLSPEAALLCINSIRTLFQFIDNKLQIDQTK